MPDRFASEVLALIGRDLLRLRMVKQVPIAQPAAGSDWSINVPGGVIWELISVEARLVTSAVVGNRQPNVRITDADNVQLATYGTGNNLAAGSGQLFSWQPGFGYNATNGAMVNSLSTIPFPAQPGFRIQSTTIGLDVADQWSIVVLTVREWDETSIVQESEQLFTGLRQYIESGYREGSDY